MTNPCAKKTQIATAPITSEKKMKLFHPAPRQAVKNQMTPSPPIVAIAYRLIVVAIAFNPSVSTGGGNGFRLMLVGSTGFGEIWWTCAS